MNTIAPKSETDLQALREIIVTPQCIAHHLPRALRLGDEQSHQLREQLTPLLQQSIDVHLRQSDELIVQLVSPRITTIVGHSISEALREFMQKVERLIESSTSGEMLKLRWTSWRTGMPMAELVFRQTMVYRVEHVLLVDAKSGELLSHVSAPDAIATEELYLSGSVTAVLDFLRDSLPRSPRSDECVIHYGQVILHTLIRPNFLLVAIVRGEAATGVWPRLEAVASRLNNTPTQIRQDPLATQDLLKSSLIEESKGVDTNHHARSQRIARVLVASLSIALIAGLMILAKNWWQRRVVQNEFVKISAELAAHPGVVIARAERLPNGLYTLVALMTSPLHRPQLAVPKDLNEKLQIKWAPLQPAFDLDAVASIENRAMAFKNLSMTGLPIADIMQSFQQLYSIDKNPVVQITAPTSERALALRSAELLSQKLYAQHIGDFHSVRLFWGPPKTEMKVDLLW